MAPSVEPTLHAVLLAGDHVQLGHAELAALEFSHGHAPRPSAGRVRLTTSPDAARRCAQARAWGDHWGSAEATEDGLEKLQRAIAAVSDGQGSVAVRTVRWGETELRGTDVARRLGAALAAAGHPIDLTQPDIAVYAWIGDGQIHMGRQRGIHDQSSERAPDERSHFSPISLAPRRAACLVHLTRASPGGRILDPFCGTGGFLLEAAVDGYDVWGSDIDSWMVQGSLQTLTDAAAEPLAGHVFEADIGDVPELVEDVEGIVTDLPYGKASTTDGEALAALYDRAFAACSDILATGRYLVFGCARPELGERVAQHDFAITEHHEEYVHGSMTRHYFVARRS